MTRSVFCFLFLVFFIKLSAQTDTTAEKPISAMDWDELTEKMSDLFNAAKYEEAALFSGAALELARRDSGEASEAYCLSLRYHGTMLNRTGHLKEALPILEAAVVSARDLFGVDDEYYIAALSNLAMLQRDLGDRAQALSNLEEVVRREESGYGSDDPDFAIFLNNLALVSEESGLFDQALRLYQRTLELTEKTAGKESARYATRLNNIASLQFRLGDYRLALDLYSQAVAIYEKVLGKTHLLTVNAVLNIANAQSRLGQYDAALAKYLELMQLVEKTFGKENLQYIGISQALGSVYQALGQYEKAIVAFTEAMELNQRLYSKAFKSKKENVLGLVSAYECIGNTDKATQFAELTNRYLLEEIDYQFDQLSQMEQLAYFSSNNNVYENRFLSFVFRHPEHTELVQDAYDNTLVLKGLFIGNHQRMLQSLRENPDTLLQNRFAEWQALTETINQQYKTTPAKRSASFDSLILRANELERLLAQSSLSFRQTRQAIGWHDVQARLAPGEAVIEFNHFRYWGLTKITDSTLYVAYLLRYGDSSPRQIFLFEEKQLGSLKATRRLYSMDTQDGETTLEQLIWTPLSPYLKDISTLYYAPSGLLHRLNLAAIPVDKNTIMADRFQLHNIGSSRQLCQEKIQSNHPADALVFGGVRYETDSIALASTNTLSSGNPAKSPRFQTNDAAQRSIHNGNWDFLPWTETEADIVATGLKNAGAKVELKKGFAATEACFKQAARQSPAPAVLHLATHGYFFPDVDRQAASGFQASDNPLVRSGLILAGANRVWLGGESLPGQEDGILTALEISQMNLHGTELVVLSACETGLGDLKGAEGVYGLQRAFKIAGARYLIMTLWSIQDHQTQEFMDFFYKAWLSGGKDIPAAFQSAQNQLHKKYDKPFNPSLWAGFVLIE